MQSFSGEYPSNGEIFAIWGTHTSCESPTCGTTSFSFLRTASRAFAAPILCMRSDDGMIRPHAKYRPQISSFGRRFGHLVRPQLPGSAQNDQTSLSFFPKGFSPIHRADTLHVVGAYHGPTTCKVSAQHSLFWLSRVAPDAIVVIVGISL
jgi:hypothetical protein